MTSPSQTLNGIIVDCLFNADELMQKVICLYAVNKYRDELIYEISDSLADEVRRGVHGASDPTDGSANSSADDAELERMIRKILPVVRQKIQTKRADKSDRV